MKKREKSDLDWKDEKEEEDPELIEMLRRETARRIDIEALYLAEQKKNEEYRNEVAQVRGGGNIDQNRFLIRRTRVSPKRSVRSSAPLGMNSNDNDDDGETRRHRPVSPLRQTGMLRRSFIRVPPRLSSSQTERRRKKAVAMSSRKSSSSSSSSKLNREKFGWK